MGIQVATSLVLMAQGYKISCTTSGTTKIVSISSMSQDLKCSFRHSVVLPTLLSPKGKASLNLLMHPSPMALLNGS